MNWLKRRKFERAMDSEMRFHLEAQIQDYVAQGMTPQQAERRARREFGSIDLAKDESRDTRRLAWLDHLNRDIRRALRSLHRSPGFALSAILTLALGIGANAAIFSAVYAILLKPLPFREADRIYTSRVKLADRTLDLGELSGTIQNYLEWRKQATRFSDVAAMQSTEWNISGDGEPERAGGALVTTNFFSFLGVPVAHGRGFVPEEEQPGKDRVVVISDSLWRSRFAADPAAVGKSIDLQGQKHLIVGIAPPSMLMPKGAVLYFTWPSRVDIWKPQAPTKQDLEGESWNQIVLLRLKPGERVEQGREQIHALLNPPGWRQPGRSEIIPRLVPIRELFASDARLRLLLLLGASGLLLLVACTNIANLILARVASRSGEFATRIALGATRSRIMTQMLVESLLLALLGGAVASFIAYASVRLLIAYGPANLARLPEAGLNIPVLLFTIALSLITGLLCGAIPAWQAYRRDAAAGLQESARTALGGRKSASFREALVGVQMALGTALLASAALLLHSFIEVMRADRGYDIERVLAVKVSLSLERYSNGQQLVTLFQDLTDRIRALPGVQAVGAISQLPATADSGSQVVYRGTDTDEALILERPIAGYRQVTPGYFAASGSMLLTGRFFEPQDPVGTAVLSESLARQLWPSDTLDRMPGRTIRQGNLKRAPQATVVGIVRDVQAGAIDKKKMLPQLYRPYLPPRTPGEMSLVIRTMGEPNLAPAIRAIIRETDPAIPRAPILTMREIVSSTVAERQFQMLLTGLFAVVALLLGAVGIYGVVSYSVACRTRDIGLRMALGAMRKDILSWVLANGMRPVILGLAIGLAGATAIATTLRSLLYGVSPYDPIVIVAVVTALLLSGAVACYLPARRASMLDPTIALRHE
jgi:predicted permease